MQKSKWIMMKNIIGPLDRLQHLFVLRCLLRHMLKTIIITIHYSISIWLFYLLCIFVVQAFIPTSLKFFVALYLSSFLSTCCLWLNQRPSDGTKQTKKNWFNAQASVRSYSLRGLIFDKLTILGLKLLKIDFLRYNKT